jgi:hypothetical protein
MPSPKQFFLALSFLLIGYDDAFAAIWVNNTPGAWVKQIEIYESNNAILPDNPLLPTGGYANITFHNDVVYTGLALHPTAGSTNPSFFLLVENNYTLYTVYFCQSAGSPAIIETCDGIGLRLENGQLCAGLFQYTTLVDKVIAIADIGCFTLVGITRPAQRAKRDFLQRYTKEQLIDIIGGVKPINPVGPVCLTCPPWDGYKRDVDLKLRGLQVKKYKIEVREMR